MNNVTMYDGAKIAPAGFGPAGTGHPPPPNAAGALAPPAPFLDRVRLGLDHAHEAANRIESVLHRFDPYPSSDSKPQEEWAGHAQAIGDRLHGLIARLHGLADRLEALG